MKSVFLLLLVGSVFLAGCMFGGKRIKGNGNIKTEQRNVSQFDEVEVHGSVSLYVSQGDFKTVQIETDENLLQYIELEQQGDRLEIKNRSGVNLNPSGEIKVYVTAPEFRSIHASGACSINGVTKLEGDDKLTVGISGAGSVKLDVDVPEIKTEVSGSGEVELKGETKKFVVDLSGAANARCFNLLTEETEVSISGAGEAEVHASRQLSVDVSGAGNVKYKGEVKNINQKISGAGSVTKVD